jgi:ATP-dependent helicase/nuclease subunit B
VRRPALGTIAPNMPFLDTLAAWWLHQTQGRDPLAGADGLILLPTRRAIRGLTEAFLRQSAGAPLLLPRIMALGGLDEAPLALSGGLAVPPAVTAPQRLAVLSRLILAMGGQHGAPRSADLAWQLAVELAALLDEAARAEIVLELKLPQAVGQEFAAHWNVTLEFLQIVTRAWPAWLQDQGLCDVAARQIALLHAQSATWEAAPPATAIIAAGTTGAIPAVARLLRVVANLPHGQVVLPGLDLALDDHSWDSLDETHPQANLRALLKDLGVERGDVLPWPQAPEGAGHAAMAELAPATRVQALSLALLPAASLHQWRTTALPPLHGVSELHAADQQEEAAAIALVLRAELQASGTTAALVTPDRRLAQRVTAELLRFGVVADDSAGEALAETPPAVFLRLLAVAWAEALRPVALLSLLKHPLAACGLKPAACRAAARALEAAALRGPAPAPGLAGLRSTKADPDFQARLADCLAVLPPGEAALPPAVWLRALIQAAENLAASDAVAEGGSRLWAEEEGEALAAHLAQLLEAFTVLPPQEAASLPGLLASSLAGIAVRSRRAMRGRQGAEHPRVFIWGLLEARLQSADLMVLGGLAETVWPPLADPGPWMNRPMRKAVGLPSPEQAVGQAAHDFVSCACAAPRIVLSVPKRRDAAPAVPSRWITRLGALLGRGALAIHPAADWARALDRPSGAAMPVLPPAPSPPVALRPRRLRVTEIETWLRDPYAIYARHVLRLKKLEALEASADAADYGRIVHGGLQRFYTAFGTAWPADAAAQLIRHMDAALDHAAMRPALAAWWRPRLHRIAAWVADAEADRRSKHGNLTLISPEQPGLWVLPAQAGPFTLSGRADRIERRFDGAIAILDYKTGAPPMQKDVEDGRAPQLPLEAAMVEHGAFGEQLRGQAVDLTYWQISGGFEPGQTKQLFRGDAAKVAAASALATEKLSALIDDFDQPGRAYLSQPHPGAAPRFSDYAQLARVAEWAAADD